jgi:DNA-binding Lrp family transcriptional regulator
MVGSSSPTSWYLQFASVEIEEEVMPNGAVDDIDLALLAALQADARVPIAELSRAAGVSRATAYARMAQLRKAGVIDRFTVAVNPYRVGLSVAAVLLLTTDTWTKWSSVASAFDEMPEVEFSADLAGEFDIMLLARFRDTDQLRAFLQGDLRHVTGIASVRTLLVLDETPQRSLLLPRAKS